ncbi:hypothetical protein D4764_03G0011350 [Takifugu flavidus]|uniref:Brinker DNA-binding domain-containing protein n=1 Tax=Takifugu flavidus TaxID=433684 RepID=A0A5C6NF46_9TELE|nr:hypothetical protein D4764_03G0011350 [Takifugu flavidus]
MAPVKRHAYEAYFKLQAIEYAAENGNRAAAKHFNVNESMDRNCRKQESERNFMRRWHLSIRARTTVAQRLPADYPERAAISAPSHITNMNEIPLTFDIPLTHTVEKKGTSTGAIHTTGH